MKYLKTILNVLVLVVGVIFLCEIASDIQIGFGILFVYLGISNLIA